jgi:hypothetical protein
MFGSNWLETWLYIKIFSIRQELNPHYINLWIFSTCKGMRPLFQRQASVRTQTHRNVIQDTSSMEKCKEVTKF